MADDETISRVAAEMRPEGWEAGALAVHLGLDAETVTEALDELVRRGRLTAAWHEAGDPQGSGMHVYTPAPPPSSSHGG